MAEELKRFGKVRISSLSILQLSCGALCSHACVGKKHVLTFSEDLTARGIKSPGRQAKISDALHYMKFMVRGKVADQAPFAQSAGNLALRQRFKEAASNLTRAQSHLSFVEHCANHGKIPKGNKNQDIMSGSTEGSDAS